jgi:hypothetical protein
MSSSPGPPSYRESSDRRVLPSGGLEAEQRVKNILCGPVECKRAKKAFKKIFGTCPIISPALRVGCRRWIWSWKLDGAFTKLWLPWESSKRLSLCLGSGRRESLPLPMLESYGCRGSQRGLFESS